MDPSELELSLLNLAVTARDARPSGGLLSIFAENRTLLTETHGLKVDFVALTVSDSGVGLPPDILPKIFDPFFTTKEVSKGTGLGLSQIYGFAEQSGGRVVVESEPGLGLARRVRQEAPGVPVLLATGRSQATEGLGGEFPILRKPYKLAELNRAIGALLGSSGDPGEDDADGKLVDLRTARNRRARREPQA